jgi:potassium efflux system protein
MGSFKHPLPHLRGRTPGEGSRYALALAAALLVLLAILPPALAQVLGPPTRPFSQLIELWTRQLDRIAYRAEQESLVLAEIDGLREQASDVRSAAFAAADLARNDLADTRKLLAPLDIKPGPDQPAETDAVKAERARLTEQATLSESRVKQCEVVIARADQLLERMTKLRGQLVLQNLLHREAPPLTRQVWSQLWPQLKAAVANLGAALTVWSRDGLRTLTSGEEDLTPLALWALLTIGLWWVARLLRHRFGRASPTMSGPQDRTVAAAIDGLGLVLVPILAVGLLGRLMLASRPPSPIDVLIPEAIERIIIVLLVVGLSATLLAPTRPDRRVLEFSDASAQYLTSALRRFTIIGLSLEFTFIAVTQGGDRSAIASMGALILACAVAALGLQILSNRSWSAREGGDGEHLPLVGGTWWTASRVVLRGVVLSSILFALLGYATLAAHINSALSWTGLLIVAALLAHRIVGDLVMAMAAPETPTGGWVRRVFGLAPQQSLYGQHIALLLFDCVLVVLLAFAIPAVWNVDIDAIQRAFAQLLYGVRVGGVTISLANVGSAILAFTVCLLLARLVRKIVRDRVMPTIEAPMPIRQTVDAGLNYAGVIIAVLIGVASLGIDFTNLAIVLGALSVGIGLGLQNIANNVISGVVLLLERPIKAGDWVSVSGHEGFVRRINIRATEIETFQRTHVIVPNSVFLQNPVVNRTYADTSSRIEIQLTVGFGTDVAKLEAILREAALNQPRVLRVPAPIVRFARVGAAGLEFELMVFVAQLEDRLIVTNDLNRAILARLIEEKMLDPQPATEFKLRNLELLAGALRGHGGTDHAEPPPSR